MGTIQTGNTYDSTSFSVGHARKVWREIRRQWPAGGTISNVSDWVAVGKIPAGTPCKWESAENSGKKTIKCFTDAQVKAAASAQGGINSLGINGYTDRDTPITSANTVASATAIREGDIYEYMFAPDVATILKANTKCPGVVFVQ